ncbi:MULTISPECIES: pepsin/retropepsin-like aspartic protease family protein [Bacteroides]|uniref:pepsin/retropepsin-like aspartic protease family protein n=1 Tax=Bacteroides TaxID=816 RepID=UPI000B3A503A|nr:MULTISPECIES: pepsin/retropepsin-like aspartic protease family protein [Bacteroides]MBM6945815.1 aspartyl protease family protein [Bacteroides gallinaceum]OUO53415.1 hypothetical protein B5F78_11865 [Bacteroides sp. An279]
MKRLAFLFLALVCAFHVYSQDIDECRKVVNIAVDAVNNRSTDELKKYLASDFTCAGKSGAIAIKVMELLVNQLNEHISDISEISEQQGNGTLTLVYDFNYSKKLGHKNATFVFNANNQLKQLELLSVQVKTLDKKTDFETPAQEIITVPMEIQDNMIVVTAKLNGIERKFIFDSGAQSLYLNSRYFGKDTINSISGAKSVNSSISGQDIIPIDSFDFYGIKTQNKDFVMSDLSHLLKDEGIYGLIGYQVVKDYDWLFDYANKTLTLIKPDKTADYINKMQYTTYEIPIQMTSETSHIPFVKGKIGTEEVSLGIDCGAAANLLDIALFDKLKNNLTDITTTELAGVSTQKTDVQKASVKSLALGKKLFENVSTVFNNMNHLNSRWENKIDGLIGYEILSKQKTIVSLRNKKIIFIQ